MPWSVPTIFLQSLLDGGRSHWAAILSQQIRVSNVVVGSHRLVSLFSKGLSLCPPRAPRAPAWDLPLVLEAWCLPPFEPLAQEGLRWLSIKTTFLLAITSAKRVEELYALSVSKVFLRLNLDGSGVPMWPDIAFLPKVLSRSHLNQPIRLTRFNPPPEEAEGRSSLLCPVRALKAYVEATACIWQSEQVFVSYAGPKKGCALSKQHLSHWIVDTITFAFKASGRPLPSGSEVTSPEHIHIMGCPEGGSFGDHLSHGLMDIARHICQIFSSHCHHSSSVVDCLDAQSLCFNTVR